MFIKHRLTCQLPLIARYAANAACIRKAVRSTVNCLLQPLFCTLAPADFGPRDSRKGRRHLCSTKLRNRAVTFKAMRLFSCRFYFIYLTLLIDYSTPEIKLISYRVCTYDFISKLLNLTEDIVENIYRDIHIHVCVFLHLANYYCISLFFCFLICLKIYSSRYFYIYYKFDLICAIIV